MRIVVCLVMVGCLDVEGVERVVIDENRFEAEEIMPERDPVIAPACEVVITHVDGTIARVGARLACPDLTGSGARGRISVFVDGTLHDFHDAEHLRCNGESSYPFVVPEGAILDGDVEFEVPHVGGFVSCSSR